jgi:glycosyltransferase involved in cell wall biosynthesis
MRILHIEAGRHLYGGVSQVRTLLNGLAAARVENVLVCARDGELASVSLAACVVPLRIDGDLDIRSLARFGRAIRSFAPDVVHVHSRRGADLWGGIAAARARVPAVLTRRVDSREPRLWGRIKFRPYARIVALSRAIEAQLRECGVGAERVARIPSAVDSARYRPDPSARARILTEFGLAHDARVIGVVAQLIARKGHDRLLAALPELVRREPRARVLFFGRGPREAILRAQLKALDLDEHVVFAGFRNDLPDVLPGLDVLVHPARREGLGVALLEAASCAVPIVAAAAGGVPDLIEHGRTGWLVDCDDPAALAAAVARVLSRPEERVRIGAAARSEVERRFAVEALVAAHLRLYESSVRTAPRRAEAGTAESRWSGTPG